VTSHYETLTVPVVGGDLHVGRWGTGEPIVIAAHGITATHRSLRSVAEHLGDGVTVLAPDLRGRGHSNGVTGPFGMAAHADDLVAVLDHVGAKRALVVGHSMGAFVAVVAARRHAERISGLVLVDGGLPLDLGGLARRPVDEILAAVIGPALDRLHRTFRSTEDYFGYWRVHPALAGDWNAYMEDAYAYDLEGERPVLRSGVREAAVLADCETQFLSEDMPVAVESLRHPTVLLRATKGMMSEELPLYTDSWIEPWLRRLPAISQRVVPDVNHYTILFTDRGAQAVADVIVDQLARVASDDRRDGVPQ